MVSLYRRNIPRCCALCSNAVQIDSADMLCRKRGVVNAHYGCRRFKYDPTKRKPAPKAVLSDDEDLDFRIEP